MRAFARTSALAASKEGSADIRLTFAGSGSADFTSTGQINMGTPYAAKMRYERQEGVTLVLMMGDQGFVQGPGIPEGKWAPMSTADVQLQSGQAGMKSREVV